MASVLTAIIPMASVKPVGRHYNRHRPRCRVRPMSRRRGGVRRFQVSTPLQDPSANDWNPECPDFGSRFVVGAVIVTKKMKAVCITSRVNVMGFTSLESMAIGLTALVEREQDLCHARELPRLALSREFHRYCPPMRYGTPWHFALSYLTCEHRCHFLCKGSIGSSRKSAPVSYISGSAPEMTYLYIRPTRTILFI